MEVSASARELIKRKSSRLLSACDIKTKISKLSVMNKSEKQCSREPRVEKKVMLK